jgi:hypothetical protein
MPDSPESTGRSKQALVPLSPVLLAGAGFLLTLYLFYPGIMNYDARYVHLDSLKGFYGDWQSPVMTWLWKTIDPIAPGSASMFLLIAVLYWCGVVTLTRALARWSLVLGLALPLIALTPPLFAFVGVIWRDVLMAAAWLFTVAMMFAAAVGQVKRPVMIQAVACALVVFGVLIRPNALAAAPLLITYILWPREFSWKRTGLLFVPIMIALYAIVQLVYYGALNATRQHPLHSIVVFDLGGITYYSGENQFPVTWSTEEMEALRGRCYDPSYWNVYWNGDCKFVMAKVEHEQKLFGTPALSHAWLDAVVKHPIAYIQHRLTFFKTFLFGSHLGMWTADIEHPPKTIFEDRPWFMAFKRLHDALQPTPLFRMGAWFAACLLLCALGWRRRMTAEGAFVLGVCGSGALYVLSYLPLGVASEFRYVYWAVLASAAGLMVVLLPKNDARIPSPQGMTAS